MIGYIDGKYGCYELKNGLYPMYHGCRHDTPRQAIAHLGNKPYVSPLRASDEASTAAPGLPLLGGGSGLDASSESRTQRGSGRSSRTARQ